MRSPTPEAGRKRGLLEALLARRSVLPLVACTLYVCAAALRWPGAAGGRTVVLSLLAAGVALAAVRKRTRWDLWGASLVAGSLAAPGARGWLDAAGLAGASVALTVALRAVDRMPSPGGLAARRAAPGWSMVVLGLGATTFAAAVSIAETYAPAAWPYAHARTLGSGAVLVALGALVAHVFRVRRARVLELGIAPRGRAAIVLAVAVAGAFGALAAFGTTPLDKALRLGLVLASIAVARVALAEDALAIARFERRALVLLAYGAPVAVVGSLAVSDAGLDGPVVAFIAAAVSLLLGTAAPALEKPLRPHGGALLDALEEARQALRRTDPEEALREVLVALREPAGVGLPPPELWTCEPGRVATIDAAGYLHERDGVWPDELARLAAKEPESTLRADVLEALEVRRPDLRGALRWMRDRGALCVVVIVRAGEPEGLLVVPQGTRGVALGWEEARALKDVADGLAAACHARSSLARGLAREVQLSKKIEDADEANERLRHALDLRVGQSERMTARLARAATVGIYSAASRMAFEAIERRVRIGAPLAIRAPSGVDPVPYVARAHLGGPRAESPLVLVDGTASREHDLARWRDPRVSPLALANGGMLVVLDGAALPAEVQRLLARSLAERRAPWEDARPLDIVLTLTGTDRPEELVARGLLDESLASRLADALQAPVELPGLRDRPEDLRAILTDRLAREGLRVRGRPVGLDDGAFARLVEYPFPGEDAELAAVVQRLVAGCRGDVVKSNDVELLGLSTPSPAVKKGPFLV